VTGDGDGDGDGGENLRNAKPLWRSLNASIFEQGQSACGGRLSILHNLPVTSH
jgi:hypothetical protein